jgi:O-antigen ligase
MLLSRYKVREDRMQIDSYETEGRYMENTLVINDIIFSGNINWLLFGHEVLNSPGNYGNGVWGDRQLHNDYAQVLNGSGIIGLSLYIFMNISILTYYLKLKKRIVFLGLYSNKEKVLNIVFWSFFIAYFALGLSGSISSIIYNVIRFIFLGAIIGVFKNIPYLVSQDIKIKN